MTPPGTFDRVVSVEMFEHMKNYRVAHGKSRPLAEARRTALCAYLHAPRVCLSLRGPRASTIGSRVIFSPADRCRRTICCSISRTTCGSSDHWKVSGTHYQRTAEAWLANMDAHGAEIVPIFAEPTAATRRNGGGLTGASSSWHARNYGDTAMGTNGWYRTIFSRSHEHEPFRYPFVCWLSCWLRPVDTAASRGTDRQEYGLCKTSYRRFHVDLYLPATPAPYPLVIWIHGGGWKYGDKGWMLFLRELTRQGFAIASIQYRLSGTAKYPAAIIDCEEALRWLRVNGARSRWTRSIFL